MVHYFFILDAAWDQLDDSYSQGTNIAVKDAFDHLQQEVTIKEEGYAYIYLSNESPTLIDIFFDDVTVTHTKGRVIQYNEYYPFGLQTSSSWTRESTTGNRFLYNQGTELNAQTGWYDTPFRGYDPGLGRFMQVDALAAATMDLSPYHYAGNNPVLFSDPSGLSKQKSNALFYWDTDTNQRIDRSADSGPGGDRGDDSFYRFSMQGYFYQSALPESGNHWGDKLFSNPTRDHSLMNGNAFQNKYCVSSYDYRNWAQAQRQATSYTGSIWDHGWAGNSMNEYHFVDGKAVGMTSYNLYEGGGGREDYHDFSQQQGEVRVVYSSFLPVELGYANNLLSIGSTLLGAGEKGLNWMRQYPNGPRDIARGMSNLTFSRFGTQSTAQALSRTFNGAKSLGSSLGVLGAAMSTIDYVANGGDKNVYEHVNYWVGMGLFAVAIFNPATATVGLVYGVVQVGSYLYNGKTAEENIGNALVF